MKSEPCVLKEGPQAALEAGWLFTGSPAPTWLGATWHLLPARVCACNHRPIPGRFLCRTGWLFMATFPLTSIFPTCLIRPGLFWGQAVSCDLIIACHPVWEHLGFGVRWPGDSLGPCTSCKQRKGAPSKSMGSRETWGLSCLF